VLCPFQGLLSVRRLLQPPDGLMSRADVSEGKQAAYIPHTCFLDRKLA
jgi:hypothetical protein